jgi:hypothetical protein
MQGMITKRRPVWEEREYMEDNIKKILMKFEVSAVFVIYPNDISLKHQTLYILAECISIFRWGGGGTDEFSSRLCALLEVRSL